MVDLGHPVAVEVELEEIACVMGQSLLERLQGNRVLTRFGDVCEVNVVRRSIWIKAKQERRPAFDDPPLRLLGEDPRQQSAVRDLAQPLRALFLWMACLDAVRERLSRRLGRPPRPTHRACSNSSAVRRSSALLGPLRCCAASMIDVGSAIPR
jgi:hypothetical protein